MSSLTPIITIGFDKYGEPDFSISGGIAELSLARMQQLRAMIPVAIGQSERFWWDHGPLSKETAALQSPTSQGEGKISP